MSSFLKLHRLYFWACGRFFSTTKQAFNKAPAHSPLAFSVPFASLPSLSSRCKHPKKNCQKVLAWIMHVRSFCATGTLCYQGVSHQVKGPIGTLLIRVY